jgi:hypothetical protein
MSFFLTDEQEDELTLFLDEENRKICEEQLESRLLPDELSSIVKSSLDAGSPLPAFDPLVGYYTISFTPCSEGNRIYVHHHLTNKSKALIDPARDNVELTSEDLQKISDKSISYSEEEFEEDKFDPAYIEMNGPPEEITTEDVVSNYGSPPQELLDELDLENVDQMITIEKQDALQTLDQAELEALENQ